MRIEILLKLRIVIALAVATAGLAACESKQYYSFEDFVRIEKIDAHTHLNSLDPALVEQAAADNFELLTVNVDYPDFLPVSDQYEIALLTTSAAHSATSIRLSPESTPVAALAMLMSWITA